MRELLSTKSGRSIKIGRHLKEGEFKRGEHPGHLARLKELLTTPRLSKKRL